MSNRFRSSIREDRGGDGEDPHEDRVPWGRESWMCTVGNLWLVVSGVDFFLPTDKGDRNRWAL